MWCTPGKFAPDPDRATPRTAEHKAELLEYPDPRFYLGFSQKYFFRSEELRALRIQQVCRYFAYTDGDGASAETHEDTCEAKDEDVEAEPGHKDYDKFAQEQLPGKIFRSTSP